MMLSMGLDGLPEGFGLGALAAVFLVMAAMSLVRRPVVQRQPVPVRSLRRG